MKSILLPTVIALGFASTAFAETYQATGPVLEVTESKIVIQKTKTTKWEFARTPSTKVSGDLKVGSTVTIHYSMTAVSSEEKTESKEEKKAAKTSEKKASEAPTMTKKKAS